ncbi:sulfurtransferase TusA family protein [Succinivibrio faecicola]|uniref:Sulfurtransferase TusA family protein n=1 Tax=Succinivibrio faecicola TaxID=2820300 RepID=A0ABS7DKU1_9GAMM|nr:sulfurtransferase TusA family protein [Succinivibrio faecicola]MBW7571156.1 sulfurtransferase TusA family protein [Succinivibrio faecicola]
MNSSDFDDFLDITKDQCPITFLKASLKLEEMNIGAVLKIHLNDGEPFNNISRTLKKDGQQIISSSSLEDGSKIIYVKKLVETLSE